MLGDDPALPGGRERTEAVIIRLKAAFTGGKSCSRAVASCNWAGSDFQLFNFQYAFPLAMQPKCCTHSTGACNPTFLVMQACIRVHPDFKRQPA